MPEQQPGLTPFIQLSAAGGVNHALENHRELRPDELDHGENITVRGGMIHTRPGFRWLEEHYTDEHDVEIFRHGKVQGSSYYGNASVAQFVYAIDGNLFGFDPLTSRILNLNPNPRTPPFSQEQDFIYFEERGDYLIAQDGTNAAVVIAGESSRYADPADYEVSPGLMMADGWGYLALVDTDRRKLYISDHEVDPSEGVTALTFDANLSNFYYLGAPYFEVPTRLGRITGISFVPWSNTVTGYGPLAVFCEQGVITYDISIPRSQWTTQDIATIILGRTGAVAHKAILEWGNDLWFVDQHGRIRSIRSASTDENTRRVRYTDTRVSNYYDDAKEEPELRRWRQMVAFDDRIFTTIWPEMRWINDPLSKRFSVAHRGMVVWEGLVTETTDFTSERDIWAGVWTGINPAALDSGLFATGPDNAGQTMAVALSVDSDGCNRLYSFTKNSRHDDAPWKGARRSKRIKSRVQFARTEFALPFGKKRVDKASLRMTHQSGEVDIRGWLLPDCSVAPIPWFEHHGLGANAISLDPLDVPGVYCEPRLNLPDFSTDEADPITGERLDAFYSVQVLLEIVGPATLDFFALEARGPEDTSSSVNTRDELQSPVPRMRGESPLPGTYDALTSPPKTDYL